MKPGEILVFAPGDDWIEKAIAKITQSNACHAALVYGTDTVAVQMAEVGGHGLQLDGMVEDDVNGMTARVLRLRGEPDPGPVMGAVGSYLREGVKFDYAGIVLLAGVLIFKCARPTVRWTAVTGAILDFAAHVLEASLRAYAEMPKRFLVMTCSQFVYQCFLDAGEEYRLQIDHGVLQGAAPPSLNGEGHIRLAGLMDGAEGADLARTTGRHTDGAGTTSSELAHELYLALEEGGETGPLLTANAPEIQALVARAKRFLELAQDCLRQSGSTVPLHAIFVAPCDLEKAENILWYDTRRITRIQARETPDKEDTA